MPRPETPPLNRAAVLRAVGFGLAVALGAVAIWLIVTSTTQKRLELGVLAGLWGLLLGAFSVFGSRRHPDAAHGDVPQAGTGLELRSRATEVESLDDVAARRAEEQRLQEFLRHEIREAVNREVGSLRAEITQLRTDLLEKVGGQLRLEHIETTRVIGSDLEALQDEIRALKAAARDPLVTRGARLPDGTVVEREVVERAVVDGAQATRTARSSWPVTQQQPSSGTRTVPSGPSGPGHAPVRPAVVAPGTGPSVAGPADATGPIGRGGPAVHEPAAAPAQSPAAARAAQPAQPAQPAGRPWQPGPQRPAQQPARPGTATGPLRPVGSSAPRRDADPAAPAGPTARAATGQTPPAQGPAAPPAPGPVQRPATPSAPQSAGPSQPAPATPPAQAVPPAQSARSAQSDDTPARPLVARDPFADLPRITPWVDDEPLPARPAAGPDSPRDTPGSTPPTYVRPPAAPPEPPGYEGRRRRRAEEAAAAAGRIPSAERDTPGRRRRSEDDIERENLLAELLKRERH